MNNGTQVRIGRRVGASPEARARMKEADDKAIWSGTCRLCGKLVKGDLVNLMEHKCGDAAEEDGDDSKPAE